MSGTCGGLGKALGRRLCTKALCNTRMKATVVSHSEDPTTGARDNVKPFEDIPGPKCYPIIGSLPSYLPGGRFHNMEHNQVTGILRKEYGNLYKEITPGGENMVHTFEAEDVETVFRNDGKFPLRESFFTLAHYNKKFQSNNQGLLTSQMERWHYLRKNVQKKMMRPKSVAAYIPEHNLVADDLVKRIYEERDGSGDVEDMRADLTKYAAECIGVVCFNKRIGTMQSDGSDNEADMFTDAVRDITHVTHAETRQLPLFLLYNTPTFKKLIRAQTIIKDILDMFGDIITGATCGGGDAHSPGTPDLTFGICEAVKYSNQALEDAQKRHQAGVDVDGDHGDLVPYLLSKTELTNDEVLTIISEFIFAGVDTTSTHLCYQLYLLGRHTDIQERLYEEIRSYLPTDDVPITENAINNMSYLKAVTKETHRVHPVVTGDLRRTQTDMVLSGYHVPAGTRVALHTVEIARDPKEFPDPESFIPERWIRGNALNMTNNPFALLPFGFGPRSCVGKRFAEQEAQIAVMKILQKFRVLYIGEELRCEASILYTPINNMAFRFIAR